MSSTLGGPSHEHKLETQPAQPAPMQQATELKLEPEPVQPVQPAPMQQATELKLEPEPVQPAPMQQAIELKLEPEPVQPAPMQQATELKLEPEPVQPVQPAPMQQATELKLEPEPVQPAPMQQATDEAFKFFDSAGPVAGYGHYPQADPETKIEDTGLGIGSGQVIQPVEPPDVGRSTDMEFKLEPGAPHEAGFALFADTAQQAPLENPAEAQMASPLLARSFTFFDVSQASTASPPGDASAAQNELIAVEGEGSSQTLQATSGPGTTAGEGVSPGEAGVGASQATASVTAAPVFPYENSDANAASASTGSGESPSEAQNESAAAIPSGTAGTYALNQAFDQQYVAPPQGMQNENQLLSTLSEVVEEMKDLEDDIINNLR